MRAGVLSPFGVVVSVNMRDKFQQSLPICGWCLSSVLRQSGGHCRYATETGTHSVELCTNGLVIDMPVVVHVKGRRQHCRGAEAVSLGPAQQTTEIPSLQSIDMVFDVPVCRSSSFLGCGL